jgi:hypothetical protein
VNANRVEFTWAHHHVESVVDDVTVKNDTFRLLVRQSGVDMFCPRQAARVLGLRRTHKAEDTADNGQTAEQ